MREEGKHSRWLHAILSHPYRMGGGMRSLPWYICQRCFMKFMSRYNRCYSHLLITENGINVYVLTVLAALMEFSWCGVSFLFHTVVIA